MQVTTVMDVRSPLPFVKAMNITGATQVLAVAGSGYLAGGANASRIGMEILVDATVVGTCDVYANTAGVHMAFVPVFIPLTLNAASSPYALTLRPIGGTQTDWADRFSVTLIEW